MDTYTFLRLIPALPGLIFILTGLIMRKYPAKKRNMLYGYRTTSSMKSQEAWDAAQRIGATESIRLGIFQACIGLLVGYTVATEIFPVAYLIVSAVACGIALIARTEMQLRRMNFEHN